MTRRYETGWITGLAPNKTVQALSWAADNGVELLVKLLLDETEVDVNSRDMIYQETPLWWAVRNNHEPVVKLLLNTGALSRSLKSRSTSDFFGIGIISGHRGEVI
jgi:ankyrin repeat protein